MSTISHILIEAADPAPSERLWEALGISDRVQVRTSEAEPDGFRGFTVSLVVPGPSDVDALMDTAQAAGATVTDPASRSLWGYGGAVRSADGTSVTFASSSKKDSGAATGVLERLILQLGVDDVAATRTFYTAQGLSVGTSYGKRYVEFETGSVTLTAVRRKTVAKVAGVDPTSSGAHRMAIVGGIGPLTDPDGFVWESLEA
ncbi:glyoxalase [Nesterenkonia sp. CL21]|uniref:glyoxalase n=1 Tax=Nesterenkonia sp. CL21 TaxID=3064894 RepID=UPI00287A1454|nr:glyoxalase [Nesterenkonia sp. CL21]MDS2173620.1 glyoxalase [Nesterenkonia sp. CL21]